MRRVALLFLIGIGFSSLVLAAPPLWMVQEDSRVGFVATQAGAPVEGVFEAFEANIQFDPADIPASTVRVVIHVGSVNSQSADRDSTIRLPSLFDVTQWPTAVFEATSFRAGVTDGQYIADGTLTMRDVTKNVSMVFDLTIEDDRALAKGFLDILRLDYGIGQGMWTDTSVVANEVTITIDITASR